MENDSTMQADSKIAVDSSAGAPSAEIRGEDFLAWGTFILVLFGFLLTYNQLRIVIGQHKNNHDWSRRKAAEDICLAFAADNGFKEILEEHLDWSIRSNAVSLGELKKALLKADGIEHPPGTIYEELPEVSCGKCASEVLQAVHRLLNYYESFARGIKEKVYDEGIIRRAYKGHMELSLKILKPYIDKRKIGNSKIWEDCTNLVDEWKQEGRSSKRKETDS